SATGLCDGKDTVGATEVATFVGKALATSVAPTYSGDLSQKSSRLKPLPRTPCSCRSGFSRELLAGARATPGCRRHPSQQHALFGRARQPGAGQRPAPEGVIAAAGIEQQLEAVDVKGACLT